MANILALIAILNLPTVHGFLDGEVDTAELARGMAWRDISQDPVCVYSFGWGRNTVTVTYEGDEGKSECNFTHSERVQIPASSTGLTSAIFYQHYTCADGSRAVYSTNWLGAKFVFRHFLAGSDEPITCR